LQLSGRIDGGIPVGNVSTYAGQHQHGKSIIGKALIRNAQRKGIYCIVIDDEFEWDWDQAKSIGIDCSKEALNVQQMNQIEPIQSFILNTVKGLTREERNRIFFVIDSWGGLTPEGVTKKAEEGKQKQDNRDILLRNMPIKNLLGTRCSYYITNHVYANISGYGDPYKIAGGSRLMYLSHCVLQSKGKEKEYKGKDDDKIFTGGIISTRCFKSRCSREFTEVDFRIKYDGGLDMFYGLLPFALEGGYVTVDKKTSRYSRNHIKDDKKLYEKDLYNSAFWLPLFTETDFKQYVEKIFKFDDNYDTASETQFIEDLNKAPKLESVKTEVVDEKEDLKNQ
jgi:RecA/RadA recombinase